MEENTKDISFKVQEVEEDAICQKGIFLFMMANGVKIKNMEKENIIILMVLNIMVTFLMIWNMVMDSFIMKIS